MPFGAARLHVEVVHPPPLLPPPPVELLDLATGYQRSRTLFTLVELGVPTLLAGGPLKLEALARALDVHPLAADRFLNACVALGLLRLSRHRYRNAPVADRFLVRDSPTYLGDQILLHGRTTYGVWGELSATLRTWRPAATDGASPVQEDQGADALRAQHNLARLVGHALARAYDFGAHGKLLDLGGGTGAMALSACALHPGLLATVLDLPSVAGAARDAIRDAGLADRVRVAEGNFKTDPLPAGYDVALLANLLSVSSEATNRALFRRIHEQLPEGGAIILCGWILDDDRTSPTVPVLFCLQDINWRAPDVERSGLTYCSWLRDAGFAEVEHRPLCAPTSVVIGRKLGRSRSR